MIELEQTAGVYSLRAGELGLTYAHRRDRWRHELAVRHAGQWRAIVVSVEGLPDESTPASPAFQDLRLEQLADEVYEFQLFGQAGQGIYSAAVRFDGAERIISFDLCARPKRPRAAICDRSTYTVPPGDVLISEPRSVIVRAGDDSAAVKFCSVGFSRQEKNDDVWTEVHTTESTGDGRGFALAAVGAKTSNDAARLSSIRWQYRVRVVG